jgi:hypothetical protein
VPAPPEDDRKPSEPTPDPELNPMNNTLLAENMGRWAEVYFTTPADKRDEAVQELLRELKSGSKSQRDTTAEPLATLEEINSMQAKLLELQREQSAKSNSRNHANTVTAKVSEPAEDGAVLCPACLSKNKAGQRFCGLCGFGLAAGRPNDEAPKQYKEVEQNEVAAAPIISEPVRAGDDWGWLHERNRRQLTYEQPGGGAWKYVLLLLVIFGASTAGYWWWRTSKEPSAAGAKSSNASNGNNKTNDHSPVLQNNESVPSPSSTVATRDAHTKTSAPPRDTPAARNQPLGSTEGTDSSTHRGSNTSSLSQEQGGQELERGRAYLEGHGVPKDSAIAAQWLWKSVAKQNTQAAVILSRMYATGDGVQKSCDQARLLLAAAAQRGSDEERKKLKEMVLNCQ